jgi:hypothetical protein
MSGNWLLRHAMNNKQLHYLAFSGRFKLQTSVIGTQKTYIIGSRTSSLEMP